MSGKRIYELTEKSNLENDYFMALDKSGTANAQKVNVSKILNPINNISGSSDEYSASKAYTKGDLVIHDNKLYVCNTSCSAAAWSTNQGYFTQSTLATEVTNVKSSLNGEVTNPAIKANKFLFNTNNEININTINQDGYIMGINSAIASGTMPPTDGVRFVLIGMSAYSASTNKLYYGVQIAFGFGSLKAYIRRVPYSETAQGVWTSWTEL